MVYALKVSNGPIWYSCHWPTAQRTIAALEKDGLTVMIEVSGRVGR